MQSPSAGPARSGAKSEIQKNPGAGVGGCFKEGVGDKKMNLEREQGHIPAEVSRQSVGFSLYPWSNEGALMVKAGGREIGCWW